MPVRSEDYRRYERKFKGRGYRILRIYSNNFRSMIGNKWSIIVISISFLFLFFSVLEVVFSAPAEEIQKTITEDLFSEKFFDIGPAGPDDLSVEAPLNSTFDISYTITNVGSNSSTPLVMVLLPNDKWEAEWWPFIGELQPGDSKSVSIGIRVPSTLENFSYIPENSREQEEPTNEETPEKTAPRSVGQSLDIPDDLGSLPLSDFGSFDIGSISSPFSFFGGSYIFRGQTTRMIMVFVIPDDVNTTSVLEGKEITMDPRISSAATLVSVDPEDYPLTPSQLVRAKTSTLEINIEGSKDGIRRVQMTALEYAEFRVSVRNIGTDTVSLSINPLLMPLYDPMWYVDFRDDSFFLDDKPSNELAPGEVREFHVTINSGYFTMKMPYNILIVVSEISNDGYNHIVAGKAVVEITGPPKEMTLEEKLFDTFWGGGFNYAKFLFIVLLTAVCGSGIIANDLKNNTFTLYLSRPITWYDYMIGKFLALSSILSIITLVPAVLVFVTRMAFVNESFMYILEHLWLLGGMILAYVVALVIISSIAMALSSMTKRGIFAGVGIFGLFIFASIVSDIMVDVFETEIFKVMNVNLMLKNLVKPLYGISYSSDQMGFNYGVVVIVCMVILVASWIMIFSKFNNKEVAR